MSSTIVEREPHKAQIDEGVHEANIEAVEAVDAVETAYGIKNVIYVTFNIEGKLIKRRYNKSWNPSSALFKLVSDLRPGELPMKFDVADLVGDNCRVLVAHNTTDSGDTWVNIVQVSKPKPQSEQPKFETMASKSLHELGGDPELTRNI
jgi:hypothetical protein